MRAIVIRPGEDGPRLSEEDVPDPVPGAGELLVAVRAIGLNRADLLLRPGHYERLATRPPAPIAGLEAAGEVVALGPGVTRFAVGDRVMGMPSGAYAQRTLLHERLALPVPQALSWEQAGALPVALLTAHDALATAGGLRAGDAVLVQGASSGVGIVAVQAARLLGASRVIGTTTSAAKHAPLAALGVDPVLDARADFAEGVLAATGGAGADVIVDLVGASAAAGHLRCAAIAARWVQVGRVGGALAQIDLNEVSRKRIALLGVTFRTRDLDAFAAVVAAAWRDLGDAVADARLRSPIDSVWPMEQVAAAHARMRRNEQFGKLVLRP
jgi:NADPH:quinone reductase-like Zn-dependent oxidoreductase